VHPSMIWIVSLRNVVIFSATDDREVIYPCLFAFKVFKQCVTIVLQHTLASIMQKKIVLAKNVYSKPLITIRSHGLHVGDI